MKLTNGAVQIATEAMTALCGPTNRLPVVAALKADRTLRALAAEAAIFEPRRNQYIQDHGAKTDDGWRIEPGMDGWDGYVEMHGIEVEVAVEPVKMADVEQGYARDPETGRKEALDISPAQLGALVALGIIESQVGPSLAKDVA
jgi:hypothetical protein